MFDISLSNSLPRALCYQMGKSILQVNTNWKILIPSLDKSQLTKNQVLCTVSNNEKVFNKCLQNE